MKSLPGYFEHIAGKTYIDKYPKSIIKLDELMHGKMLEFGPGTGNDLIWLLQHGMMPDQLYSVECDKEAYRLLSGRLYQQMITMFQEGLPLERLFSFRSAEEESRIRGYTPEVLAQFWVFMHLPVSAEDHIFQASAIFEFVYANNSLHCAGSLEGIADMLSRAYDHLKPRGVLFGRTLSNDIDPDRLVAIQEPQDENQEFALSTARAIQDSRLIGVAPNQLEAMAKAAGFSDRYTERREHAWKPTTDFYFRFVR